MRLLIAIHSILPLANPAMAASSYYIGPENGVDLNKPTGIRLADRFARNSKSTQKNAS